MPQERAEPIGKPTARGTGNGQRFSMENRNSYDYDRSERFRFSETEQFFAGHAEISFFH